MKIETAVFYYRTGATVAGKAVKITPHIVQISRITPFIL